MLKNKDVKVGINPFLCRPLIYPPYSFIIEKDGTDLQRGEHRTGYKLWALTVLCRLLTGRDFGIAL